MNKKISLAILILVALVPVLFAKFLVSTEANIGELMQKVTQLNQNNEHQKAISLILSTISDQKEGSILRMLLVKTFELYLEEELKKQEEAMKNSPQNDNAFLRASNTMEVMGNKQGAMEVLLEGISQNPKSTDLWMKIAKFELEKNRKNEALDIFKEVIRLDPKNSDAFNNAAFLITKEENINNKDLNLAYLYIKKALNISPKNNDYLHTLLKVKEKMTKKEEKTEFHTKFLTFE